jgi:hypothetical protein
MGTQTTWFHSITAIRYTKSFRVLSSRQISSNAPRHGFRGDDARHGVQLTGGWFERYLLEGQAD